MRKLFFPLFTVLLISLWMPQQAEAQIFSRISSLQHSLVYNNTIPNHQYLDKVIVNIRAWDATPFINIYPRRMEVQVYRHDNSSCPTTSSGVLLGKTSFLSVDGIRYSITVDFAEQLVSCPDPCTVDPYSISVKVIALTEVNRPAHFLLGPNTLCAPVVLPPASEGITAPAEGANIFTGGSFNLTWNPSFFGSISTVQIQVFSNGTLRFSGDVPNNGLYSSYDGPDGTMQVIVTGGGKTDTVNFEYTRD